MNKGGAASHRRHLPPPTRSPSARRAHLHTRRKVRYTGRLTTSHNILHGALWHYPLSATATTDGALLSTPLPPRSPGWVFGLQGSCRMLRAGDARPPHEREATMDWKLEVVPIPVSDVERAKRFYSEQVGFVVDLDTHIGEGMRLVQLRPPWQCTV